MELPKRAGLPPNRGHGDVNFPQEGDWRMIIRKGKVEIGNFGLMQRGRQHAEREWHEALYRARGTADLVIPPEIKKRYLQVSSPPLFHLELMFQLVGDVRGKKNPLLWMRK